MSLPSSPRHRVPSSSAPSSSARRAVYSQHALFSAAAGSPDSSDARAWGTVHDGSSTSEGSGHESPIDSHAYGGGDLLGIPKRTEGGGAWGTALLSKARRRAVLLLTRPQCVALGPFRVCEKTHGELTISARSNPSLRSAMVARRRYAAVWVALLLGLAFLLWHASPRGTISGADRRNDAPTSRVVLVEGLAEPTREKVSTPTPRPAAAHEPAGLAAHGQPARGAHAAHKHSGNTATAAHPVFDFDRARHGDREAAALSGEGSDAREIDYDEDDDLELTTLDDDEGNDIFVEDDDDEQAGIPARDSLLPFSCPPCASSLESAADPATCARYNDALNEDSFNADGGEDVWKPGAHFLGDAVMHEGSSADVRRVLTRLFKSSLYGAQRARARTTIEGREGDDPAASRPGEDSFRTLVLGGSVSNCRGVDPDTECWHALIRDWLSRTLPLEGTPVAALDIAGEAKRSSVPSTRFVKRQAPKRAPKRRKKKKKKTKSKSTSSRKPPEHRVVNLSKSATGSAFFAYCYDEELRLRRKDIALGGEGPDLVLLEFGINDVWPHGEVAQRDFARLVRRLQALPSHPALVILDTASLLLAQSAPTEELAEYIHLPVARELDVPLLSLKQALFGERRVTAEEASQYAHLFLADSHHPNIAGHALMADILAAYLEKQACSVQAELMTRAGAATALALDPEHGVVVPSPRERESEGHDKSVCLQLGNEKAQVKPLWASGWDRFAWARDKQYMVADTPGSRLKYRITVGSGGQVVVDWLRSRFYDLGDILVCALPSWILRLTRADTSLQTSTMIAKAASRSVATGTLAGPSACPPSSSATCLPASTSSPSSSCQPRARRILRRRPTFASSTLSLPRIDTAYHTSYHYHNSIPAIAVSLPTWKRSQPPPLYSAVNLS